MADEDFYACALTEFEEGPDKGFLARAIVRARGDETRVKPAYIELRVAQMRAALAAQARANSRTLPAPVEGEEESSVAPAH